MSPSPNQVSTFLQRLRHALEQQSILVEVYALDRAAEELGWDHTAILEELRWLTARDFLKCQKARNPRYRDEVIWIFRPEVLLPPELEASFLWIRLIERNGFIVVSFHEA